MTVLVDTETIDSSRRQMLVGSVGLAATLGFPLATAAIEPAPPTEPALRGNRQGRHALPDDSAPRDGQR